MSERGILLFRVEGRRMAAPVASVERIVSSTTSEGWVLASPLGAASPSGRGLVATLGDKVQVLAVDEVEGIESVSSSAIHPLPGLARDAMDTRGVEALVDREDELLLLVDVQQMLLETTKEFGSDAEDE